MDIPNTAFAFAQIGATFSLAPFDTLLQPLLDETLREQSQDHKRRGTRLLPRLLVWLVLVLTLRRDLNYDQALNWMLSGFRWLTDLLPATSKWVSDGAISHARVKLGIEVFRVLFTKLVAAGPSLPPDFHEWRSVIFDGTTGTMPDTEPNRTAFGKPHARNGSAAFPQVRLMTLLAVAPRRLLEMAFAPYIGKGTGERNLVRTILARGSGTGLLYLLDASLYALDILWTVVQKKGAFLVKVPAQVKLPRKQRVADGSWLAELTGKIADPEFFPPGGPPTLEDGHPDCTSDPHRNSRIPAILVNDQSARPGHLRARAGFALSSALGSGNCV